jgi:hypothetical protein
MLARSAGRFQYKPGGGEDTAQHIENGVAVACGGRVFKAVIGHGALDVNAG